MCIFLWGIFAIYMHIQGILLPKHTYIFCEVFFLYTCISKVPCYPNIHIYFVKYFAIYMRVQGILLPKHIYIYVLWDIFAIYMHIQGILPPKHTYIYLWSIFATYMHIQGIFLPKHTYIYFLWGMTTFWACAHFI